MLLATKLWAVAHLLANGTLADVLLFGGFLAWAVADRISVKRRPPAEAHAVPGAPPRPYNDAIAVVGGLAVYALFVLWAHRWLFGVSPLRLNARSACRVDRRSRPGPPPSPSTSRRIGSAGTVYGVAAEPSRRARRARRRGRTQPPYKAPPKAPVLYVKPRNTLVAAGRRRSRVDDGVPALEVGAALGIVDRPHRVPRRRSATRWHYVAGYVDRRRLSACRTTSYYRPQIRFKARDGFCPIGPRSSPRADVADPDALGVRVAVDGELVQRASTGGRVRGVGAPARRRQRVHDAAPGDVLLSASPPARRGCAPAQRVAIEIDGLGRLETPLAVARGERRA